MYKHPYLKNEIMPNLKNKNDYLLLKWLIYLVSDEPYKIIPQHNATTYEGSGMTEKNKKHLTKISIAEENYFKMALIFLRINAKLPVILMGETGIGKTALI